MKTITRLFLAVLAVLSPSLAYAQIIDLRQPWLIVATLPATCTYARPLVFVTTAGADFGLHQCNDGTLESVGSGGGGGGTISGTIADTQIAFATAADTIGGDNRLRFVSSTGVMTVNGAYGTVTTDLMGANSNLTFTSRFIGAHANDLTITYVDPGMADQTLSLTIDYPTYGPASITVNLATDGMGAITTTANDIIEAFAAADAGMGDTQAVHTRAVASDGNGTGVVAAGSWQLSGGVNGEALTTLGLNVATDGSGSYAGLPAQVWVSHDTGSPWAFWGGLDDGAGFFLSDGAYGFAQGLGNGSYKTTFITYYGTTEVSGLDALVGSGDNGSDVVLSPGAGDGAGADGQVVANGSGLTISALEGVGDLPACLTADGTVYAGSNTAGVLSCP